MEEEYVIDLMGCGSKIGEEEISGTESHVGPCGLGYEGGDRQDGRGVGVRQLELVVQKAGPCALCGVTAIRQEGPWNRDWGFFFCVASRILAAVCVRVCVFGRALFVHQEVGKAKRGGSFLDKWPDRGPDWGNRDARNQPA